MPGEYRHRSPRRNCGCTYRHSFGTRQTGQTHLKISPALKPRGEWEGSRTKCQGFKPDLRNSAVRHYRGGHGKRRHGGIVNPSCNRKSKNGNPPPKARRARGLSQQARYAPLLYPTAGPKKTLMKNRGEGGVGHQTADEGCLSRVTIGSEGPLFKSHEDSSAGEHRDTGSLFICDRGFLSCMHQTSRRVVSAKGTIQHAPRRNFRIPSLLPLQSFGMRIVGPRVRTLRRNS